MPAMALQLRDAAMAIRRGAAAGYPSPVPTLPVRRASLRPPRVVVVGDLLLDVVVAPERNLVAATDVPGRVSLRQGGSAATTARWIARLGARAVLVTRSAATRRAGRCSRTCEPTASRRTRSGRWAGAQAELPSSSAPGGERSFRRRQERGRRACGPAISARRGSPGRICCICRSTRSSASRVGSAGRRAVELARAAKALISVDLASTLPLLGEGRRAAWERLSRTRAGHPVRDARRGAGAAGRRIGGAAARTGRRSRS